MENFIQAHFLNGDKLDTLRSLISEVFMISEDDAQKYIDKSEYV